MLDIGVSEILLIFVLGLIVLGPEKLPRVASQVGHWIGRARGMARQFRQQLEEEVNLEQARKAQPPEVGLSEPAASRAQIPPMARAQPDARHPDAHSHVHPTDSQGRPLEAPTL